MSPIRRFRRLLALLIFIPFQFVFASATVIFMTGGPLKAPGNDVGKSLGLLAKHLADNYTNVDFQVFHNFQWKSVCELITRRTDQKFLLLGHSWGGQAVIDIATCLRKAKREIPLAITMDPVQKPGSPKVSVVPENILHDDNFYQNYCWVVRGKTDLHRRDLSHDEITNTFIEMRGHSTSTGAHSGLVLELTKRGVLYGLIDEVLDAGT